MNAVAAVESALTTRLGPRLELPVRADCALSGKIARDTARLYLTSWAVADDVAFAVLQVIAELLGNVVRHTDSTHALIVVCHLRDRIRIEIADFGQPRVPGTAPVVHEVGDEEEERRGLALVEYFSMKAGDFPNERGLTRYSEIALAARTLTKPPGADVLLCTKPRTSSLTSAPNSPSRPTLSQARRSWRSLALARARARQATVLGALERAHTRMSQAAFYLPCHLTEPKSEIES